MATVSNKEITFNNFRELDKLVTSKSKIILTCRTHYFKNNDELLQVREGTEMYHKIEGKGGYEILYLELFNKQKIQKYLEKRFSKNSKNYFKFINETYNLYDLATRPVLTNIICEILPQLEIDTVFSINTAKLYKIYTEFWLKRDDWRSYLSFQQRNDIAVEMAYSLYLKRTSEISYNEILDLIPPDSTLLENLDSERLDLDLRTCNFLNRSNEGMYKFVHKSFMEYFTANYIWLILNSCSL